MMVSCIDNLYIKIYCLFFVSSNLVHDTVLLMAKPLYASKWKTIEHRLYMLDIMPSIEARTHMVQPLTINTF